ncbi:MAG: TIGR03086 family protein [Acidimicrobiales bacterium]|nr:TIGR03086 family protein [Acidimicrobiales bacterium]
MFGSGTGETPAERFRRRSADLIDTARAVPADRWDAPSPCDDWTVRDVARHVVDVQGQFAGFIGRELEGVPSVDDDPVGALEASLGQTQANLDDEAVAQTGYDGHFGPTTYESSVDRFASADLVVHRWDLGTGAGVEVALDDRDVAASLADLDALEEPMRSMMRGPGAFGPEIEVGDDVDDQTRLLAFLGRRGR